jgi:hypothetical protein
MKRVLSALLAVVAACTAKGDRSAGGADDLVAGRTTPPDSVALAAFEDSLLGQLPNSRPTTVTPNGDTLTILDSTIWFDSLAGDYGFRAYLRNRVPYVRVAKSGGRGPGGRLIWVVKSRLRLPRLDSGERVVLEKGFCRANGREDSTIVATAGTGGDSLYRNAHNTWRFDSRTGILREIPSSGINCKHVAGEE